MSTSPSPSTVSPTNNSAITADLNWVWTHLLLLAIIVGLVFGGIYLVENLIAKHDVAHSQQENAILSQVIQQTKSLQDQLTSDEKQQATQDAKYEQTIASLADSIAKRNVVSQQQQTQDKTLDAQQSAVEINHDIPNGTAAAAGNDVDLPLDTARGVVANLDLLSTVQANLVDTKTQLADQTKITTDAQAQVMASQKVIASQNDEIAQGAKACDAKVTAAKAEGRKAGIKGFFYGVAAVLIGIAGHSI